MILRNSLVFLYLLRGIICSFLKEIPGDAIPRYVDVEDDITLPCHHASNISALWISEGLHETGSEVLDDGSLFLPNVTREMTGHYICSRESDDVILSSFYLVVRGPPDPPKDVSVRALTVVAVITWHLHLDDDWENSVLGPKTTLHLRYRQLDSKQWLYPPHHVAPSQGQVDVYNLHPNSTYEFQLWTKNSYGISDIVSVNGTTLHDLAEIELARMLEENMRGFSPRVWIVAVVVVMVVITISGLYLLIDHCQQHKFGKTEADDSEGIELVPHIIENPGYQNMFNNQRERGYNCDLTHESLLSSSACHSRTALV